MKYDEKKLTVGQKPSAQQSYVQQAGGAAGAAFQRARANQGLPSGQQSYVQQAGALQLNVGEMRNALQNGMPGNWRAANGQNSPAQAGYVSQNADTMAGLRQQMGELADQYANRGPFQVNLANDALYKQYAQQYAQMGQRAMKDTMGQAAGLTGGYGSSYAQNVGQQAYNQQLQGLNDAALSIYDRAKARWDDEGDRMLRQMDLLGNQYDRERQADIDAYGRYRDQVGDERYADELQWNRDWQQRQWDYNVGRDQIADQRYADETQWNRDWQQRQWDYNVGRDQIADQRYADETQWNRDWQQRQWDYNVGRDQIADERYNREWDYNVGRDQIADQRYNQEWEYNVGRDQIADQRYNQEWGYNTGRDTRDDGWQQAMTWLQAGIVPDASVLQAAGISAADAQRLASYYSRANAGSYGYGGSSSGSGRRSSGTTQTSTPNTTPNTTQTSKPATGSSAWINSYAQQYGRLANSSQSRDGLRSSMLEDYSNKYGKEPDSSNKAAYDKWHAGFDALWKKVQQQAIDGGYIRGYQNANENLTDDDNRFSQDVIDYWARKFGQSRQNAALAQAFVNIYGNGASTARAWERIKQLSADYYPGHANAYSGLG